MSARSCLVPLLTVVAAARLVSADPVVQRVVDHVSQTQYTRYLSDEDFLYAHDGYNRRYSPEHDLARTNIYNALAGFGLSTELDPFVYSGGTYYNVVATKPGAVTPENVFIVGAHYDSVSCPGANDNGSGVSAMLEAARVLSPYRFESTLVFIAFDREEQGLKGSAAYAAEHQDDCIRGMISLDMIAYRDPANPNTAYVYSDYPVLRSALASAVNAYSDGLTAIERPNEYGTDNWYFGNYDIPNGFLEENFVADPHYHQITDSVDTPGYIDYAYGTSMTRSAVGWLAESAVLALLPGDADGNSVVDEADAAILAAHWGAGAATVWDGDFDGDGLVGPVDASILAANWTRGTSESNAVPEPCALIAIVGAIGLAFGRPRRRISAGHFKT